MQVTPVGDKLRLLPNNEPNVSGLSEHIVFRQAVQELLVKFAASRDKLTREQAASLGDYVIRSSTHETTEETAPVVSPAEAEAYMDALAYPAYFNEDQGSAILAKGMMETLKTGLTMQ